MKYVTDLENRFSAYIEKVPTTLTYSVSYHNHGVIAGPDFSNDIGTIFPVYRYADGSFSATRLAWEVDGSTARFKTLKDAATFLVLRHRSDAAFGVTPVADIRTLDTAKIEVDLAWARTHNHMATLDGQIADMEAELDRRKFGCPKCSYTGRVEGPPPAWGYNEYFTVSCSCQHHETCDCRDCDGGSREPNHGYDLAGDGLSWGEAFVGTPMTSDEQRMMGWE